MSQTESPATPAAAGRPPAGRRSLLLVALLGVLAIIGVVAVAALRSDPTAEGADPTAAGGAPRLGAPDRAIGRPLPATSLPALEDLGPAGGLDLPATGGAPMIINFWASWCAPCINEMPMLQRVADDADLDVSVVGVDYIDQTDEAVELATRLGITYPLVRDDDGRFGQAVGLMGTPTTLLVDGDGVVRRRLTGELTEQQLRDAIAADLG
jgi:cytochrome c biogenesis protein CcmG/thiol:disulfide interchange protein DsbE